MTKNERYQELERQFNALLSSDLPVREHMNNLCALLKKEFQFFWVGFYLRKDATTLEIGPYQGEVPCFHILMGKGVCGTAAERGETVKVDDVNTFPGYIACHPEPVSEMVVPGMKNGYCHFVLDLDHTEAAWFSEEDRVGLEGLIELVLNKFY